ADWSSYHHRHYIYSTTSPFTHTTPTALYTLSLHDALPIFVICQLARDRYGVPNLIARVNDPRNQPYFDLLGIAPTVSATAAIMRSEEHTSELQSLAYLVCRLLLEKKKNQCRPRYTQPSHTS